MVTENLVLIVDDDPKITRLIDRVASTIGFDTRIVNDSTQFETKYRAFEPSVVLLDLDMPGRDGIELLRFLSDLQSKTTAILISGVDSRAIGASKRLGESLGLNMAGVFEKPFEVDDLRAELTEHLQTTKKMIDADLAGAIENHEIFVRYQPEVNLSSGEICGLEVLARWRHPTYGDVLPDDFIPFAEESGLIVPLTFEVLKMALTDSKLWTDTRPDIPLAINLSPVLLTDLKLPDRIVETVKSLDYNPERLVMEGTESAVTEGTVHSIDVLTRLRIKGVRLSIDDFGTGSSSLAQLYRLPYTEIKIDKSFVIDAMTNDEAAAIVRSTIGLGHSLGLSVVAEGIEDEETLEWLTFLGCDIGQGYYFSRPMEVSDWLAWLADRAEQPATSG